MPYLAFWNYYLSWAAHTLEQDVEETATRWLLSDLVHYAGRHQKVI